MMIVKDSEKAPATEKQKELIANLLAEMDRSDEYDNYYNVENLSMQQAKALISQLFEQRDDYYMQLESDVFDTYNF